MKQLLDHDVPKGKDLSNCTGGYIVALNDLGFVIVTTRSSSSVVYELENPPPKFDANFQKQQKQKKKRVKDTKEKEESEDGEKIEIGKEEEEKVENPIQAVSIKRCSGDNIMHRGDSGFYYICAVSRLDKSISLYHVHSDQTENDSTSDKKQKDSIVVVKPLISYMSTKRSCSLTFTILSKTSPPILLSADLSGDLFAYPTTIGESKIKKRLLLGHTASMLTSVQVHTFKNKNKFIFTSDRDEKIRITSFHSQDIHGYLLGHNSFVTTFDFCNSLCVSSSHDKHDIKIWDCDTCQELFLLKNISGGDNIYRDAVATCIKIIDVSESLEFKTPNNNGFSHFLLAIAYDQSNYVDIYELNLPPNDTTSSDAVSVAKARCNKVHEIDCKSQPLAISSFLPSSQESSTATDNDQNLSLIILVNEGPNYLQHYKLFFTDKRENSTASFASCKNSTDQSKVCQPLLLLSKNPTYSKISMPRTIISLDQKSNQENQNGKNTNYVNRDPAAYSNEKQKLAILQKKKEKAKAKDKRRKRRKREEKKNSKESIEDTGNSHVNSIEEDDTDEDDYYK